MSGHDYGAAGFEQLARQYWSAFSEMLAKAGQQAPHAANAPFPGMPGLQMPGAPQMPGWKETIDWWTRLVQPGNGQVDAALGRMNVQSGDWFGLMQQMAAGFAGRDASAEQIASAWQKTLGDTLGHNGIADMFKSMSGPGAQGFEHWLAQVAPWLGMMRSGMTMPGAMPSAGWHEQVSAALRLPTFGLAREHQERWQGLLQAQMDYRQANSAFSEQLLAVGKRAFERFESKLEARTEPGRQLESARALFDLWIDAAEEAWAEIALTQEFRRIYGTLANSQMRLRAAIQTEIEQMTGMFGLPTRTEMDASHRKVAQLERELRRLQRAMENSARAPAGNARAAARDVPAATPASAPAQDEQPSARRSAPPATRTLAAREPVRRQRKPVAASPASARSGRRATAVLPTVAAPRAVDRRADKPRADKPVAGKKKARK